MQTFIPSSRGASLLTLALALFSPFVSAAASSNATTTNSTTVGLLSSGAATLDTKWEAAYIKAQTLVAQFTNAKKVEVITSSDVASLNWTTYNLKDGDQGIAGPGIDFTVAGTDPTYQGHLAGGSGSGPTSVPYLATPHDALLQRAFDDGTIFHWVMNYTYTASGTTFVSEESGGTGFATGTNAAVSITSYAGDMEVCIVFLSAYSGEGVSLIELTNADQDVLVISVAPESNKTMVVINTVGARILDAWIDNENITAVVYGGLLGQTSGYSITGVLYGNVNPPGRLPYAIAKNESDYPVPICLTAICSFTEGNYIDYKYFDAYNLFLPGYHTTAALNNTYSTGTLTVGGRADLWDNIVNITDVISNTGPIDGHEVAQLYIQFPDEADQPIRQLRGFERVLVVTGAEAMVTFPRRRGLSYWDVVAQEWAVAPGTCNFTVGASSMDLRLAGTLDILI